jgi:hypothetical protein
MKRVLINAIRQYEDWVVVGNLIRWTYNNYTNDNSLDGAIDGVEALCHIVSIKPTYDTII